ncbi:hypothetical protein [Cupriavidus plantarum]|uniref:hypothetical protein n=1 Tax=Cupriavidus plantarum TaxID=942865 RepID=UPI00339D4469
MARSDRTSRKDRDSDASDTTAAPARPCPSRFWSRTPQGDAPLQAARNMRQHARTFH